MLSLLIHIVLYLHHLLWINYPMADWSLLRSNYIDNERFMLFYPGCRCGVNRSFLSKIKYTKLIIIYLQPQKDFTCFEL